MEVSKNGTSSPGAGYAGLELKGVRFLDAAVIASPNVERMGRNSFAGFMVDYHSASGYAKRVALGIGVSDEEQERTRAPHWGKNDVPDRVRGPRQARPLRAGPAAVGAAGTGTGDRGSPWRCNRPAWALPSPPSSMPVARRHEGRKVVEPPAKPKGTLPEQPKKEKPLDLPVKPTWRTTGEYPLIAGRVVRCGRNKGMFVTVVQHGGDFVATTSYKSGDETVSWRAEGKISRSGHVTMSLVHTQPHPPDKWLPQTRTAVLDPHGKSLEGYAAFEGGGHKFTWRLVEPREAEKKELSK